MTRLEFLKNYGSIGAECGCISPDVFMKYIRYMCYLDFKANGKAHQEAMQLTCDEHKLENTITIWRDIRFFQEGENGNP